METVNCLCGQEIPATITGDVYACPCGQRYLYVSGAGLRPVKMETVIREIGNPADEEYAEIVRRAGACKFPLVSPSGMTLNHQ